MTETAGTSDSRNNEPNANDPRFGVRVESSENPQDQALISDSFTMSFGEPELPPRPPEIVIAAKKKWADYGIIAATLYGFYGMLLMLVIEPLSASGLSLSESYNIANKTDKGIGILEAVMFMLMGIGFGFAIRSFVIERDNISVRMTQIIYLVFITLGSLGLFISSLGTKIALSEAFGVFGPASGFWYVLPYVVSTVSAVAAMVVFLLGQAKSDPA